MRHTLCRHGFLAATAAVIVGLLWLVLGIGAAADAVAGAVTVYYYPVDDVRRCLFYFIFLLLYNYITNDCLHAIPRLLLLKKTD